MREFIHTLGQVDRFVFAPERQYHTLKHFYSVDTDYADRLKKICGSEPVDPEERLGKQVSKFMSVFARNPEHVIDRLSDVSSYFITRVNRLEGKTEVQVKFSKEDYPDGIGQNRVVHSSRLKSEDIYYRDGLFFSRKEVFQPTWLLNLILRPADDTYEILTFFPGVYAPPLPDKGEQTAAEYERSRSFWDQHVIVGTLE